ncbi:hypothetical protein ACPV51_24215, partial [Vibrio astriarenae]
SCKVCKTNAFGMMDTAPYYQALFLSFITLDNHHKFSSRTITGIANDGSVNLSSKELQERRWLESKPTAILSFEYFITTFIKVVLGFSLAKLQGLTLKNNRSITPISLHL